MRERVDQVVHHQARAVARVGRTDDRQHDVEAAILRLDACPHADTVLPKSSLVRSRPKLFATSKRPPATPIVELTRKRAMVVAARLGSPWKTSLMAVTGSPRLSRTLRAGLRPVGHEVAVHHRQRPERDDVDGAVDGEDEAVGGFQRIPDLGRTSIACGAAPDHRPGEGDRDN